MGWFCPWLFFFFHWYGTCSLVHVSADESSSDLFQQLASVFTLAFCTWLWAMKITLRAPFNLLLWNGNRTENDTEVKGHWGGDIDSFSLWMWKCHRSLLGMFQLKAKTLWGKHMDHMCRSTENYAWKLSMQNYPQIHAMIIMKLPWGVGFWFTFQVIQFLL